MRGIIISSGNFLEQKKLREIIAEGDFIICADGGISMMVDMPIRPDLIIGDLDSIDSESIAYIEKNHIPILKYPEEKDETDTELALNYLMGKGFKEIIMVGVIGTRMDHTMANIFLLNRLLDKGFKGKIIDDHNEIYIVDDYIKIKKKKSCYISLIPLSLDGIVVSIKGSYYPLKEKYIEFDSTLGISNIIAEEYCEIIIHKGKAIIIEAKD